MGARNTDWRGTYESIMAIEFMSCGCEVYVDVLCKK